MLNLLTLPKQSNVRIGKFLSARKSKYLNVNHFEYTSSLPVNNENFDFI